MAQPKYDVKYPDLKGAEQHHDLKNNPGENGDAEHAAKVQSWEKLTEQKASALKSKK